MTILGSYYAKGKDVSIRWKRCKSAHTTRYETASENDITVKTLRLISTLCLSALDGQNIFHRFQVRESQ
jgi:hypothetical protein